MNQKLPLEALQSKYLLTLISKENFIDAHMNFLWLVEKWSKDLNHRISIEAII